jgi:hypothetical protein
MMYMRLSIALLLLATPIAAAAAQDAATQAAECSASGASYVRCGLWLDGLRVRRGGEGVVVAKPGFFRPLRLTQIVQGDSALQYARGFERNTARAGGFALLSAALMIGAVVVAESWDCDRDTVIGVCTNNDDGTNVAAVSLLAGGLVSGIVSGVFQQHARRDASRSVFWHNASFAR